MKTSTRLNRIEENMNNFFVEREEEIHGLILAIISDVNVLFLGPPGVAKSMMVEEWAKHIETEGKDEADYFQWIL